MCAVLFNPVNLYVALQRRSEGWDWDICIWRVSILAGGAQLTPNPISTGIPSHLAKRQSLGVDLPSLYILPRLRMHGAVSPSLYNVFIRGGKFIAWWVINDTGFKAETTLYGTSEQNLKLKVTCKCHSIFGVLILPELEANKEKCLTIRWRFELYNVWNACDFVWKGRTPRELFEQNTFRHTA